MYRKILFAVEDDEALPAAMPAVTAFARSALARVHVVHVDRGRPASPAGGSRQLVDAVIESLRPRGIAAGGEVLAASRDGEVAPLIARTASRTGADLVVVGSRGRSDFVGLILGSVSHRVAHGLDTSVLIVRAGDSVTELRKILVAVDGSAASDEAVVEAGQLAAQFGAEVMVLHVQYLIAAQGAAIVEPEAEARAVVDRAVAQLKATGAQVWGEARIGYHVASEIVSAAEGYGADLVVLGSRRPSELGGLLLGSVGHQVIHRLRKPVLLARRVRVSESVG